MINTIPLSLIEPGYGLGCACNQSGLGAVSEVVTIGGEQYSVDILLDKVLVASGPIRIYSGNDFNKPIYTVQKGQSVGKIYSYIRPSTTNGGKTFLSFDSPTEKWPNGVPKSYYAAVDSNIDTVALKNSGAITLQEQVAQEEEEKLKESDPYTYYFKKLVVPTLLTAAGIYVVVQLGKSFIVAKVAKKVSA